MFGVVCPFGGRHIVVAPLPVNVPFCGSAAQANVRSVTAVSASFTTADTGMSWSASARVAAIVTDSIVGGELLTTGGVTGVEPSPHATAPDAATKPSALRIGPI